jgi:hypothetical protein
MTKYNWNAIPKHYCWVAFDSHGIIRGFEERPHISQGFWVDENDMTPSRLGELPTVSSYQDWEESLEERPRADPRYTFGLDESGKQVMVHDHVAGGLLSYVAVVSLLNEYDRQIQKEFSHD